MNVTFWACELCRVLDFYQNYEVQVVPHVVLGADVLLKCDVFVVESLQDIIISFIAKIGKIGKNLSLQTADEAGILDDLLLVILLCSEIGEGVDDDTEN